MLYSSSVVNNPPANAGDMGLIPGLGRSPGEGSGNPFQYSCLGNPMDRGTWWAIVHGVTKSWMDRTEHARVHSHTQAITIRKIFLNQELLWKY